MGIGGRGGAAAARSGEGDTRGGRRLEVGDAKAGVGVGIAAAA
eukprot:CAMPEP_0171704552 /NCGR_PEP_ID=MMETSP0991-20121206/12723_1 /TAXON_ID=483369 /ORGANISM="non described non described, Strain CCMP2098" /LENGTH=42 /DNA_ID= /DNA_START= /DNA_END= /DNA_ORIENTATION=